MKPQTNLLDIRLALPEAIGLEPEQYDRAQTLSQSVMDEPQRWQTYLNALARLGLASWLRDRLDDRTVQDHPDVTASSGYLNVGDFKLCLIALEHVLDERVTIPQSVIERTDLAAHFYIVLEVLEEQAQLIVRGLLRHDQLVEYCRSIDLPASAQTNYHLPLDVFDPEINHLLAYLKFIIPIVTPLPIVSTPETTTSLPRSLHSTRTRLSQWLQDVCEQSWLTLDRLFPTEAELALNLRHSEVQAKRGRLIDLGMQIGAETVALLVTISPHPPNQFTVLIQLHPTSGNLYLPAEIKLILYSKAGKLLQEVTARSRDNYIQLKPFKGETGKQFSVAISLGDQQITEAFEF
jgi:Protein of unknown function (DUF1822)